MRVLGLACLVVLTLSSTALGASPEQAATDLSNEIMSPFCPGVTLHECPSAEALRLRDRIETWFAAGMSRGEIFERLESEYGSGIRAVPPASGMGLIAWLVVAAAALGALATGAILVRRFSARSYPDQDMPPMAPSDRQRIDDELARLRPQL